MELLMTVPYKKTSEGITVSDDVFGKKFNEPLVHQVVTAYLACKRAGTKAQKTRGEVRGGGRKPWRQKGTGRARAGTIRSPLWRKGGVIFAAKPRDYSQKLNKKMYREALRSIFSELARQNCLIVVEDFKVEEPKTRVLREKLKSYDLNRVVIITDEVDEKLYLSARNMPLVALSDVVSIDPVSLVNSDKVLITVNAVRQLEDWLK